MIFKSLFVLSLLLLIPLVSAQSVSVIIFDDEPEVFGLSVASYVVPDSVHVFKNMPGREVLLSVEELEVLKSQGVKIIEPHEVNAFLQDSKEIIGWFDFTNETDNSFQGMNQTICLVDSGVDFTHSALGGGWGEYVVGGYNYLGFGPGINCAVDNGACMDDSGHGTHIAGILRSVAPESKLYVVKVLDSEGRGFSNDIKKGIDRCIEVSEDYNITSISISLGAPCYDEENEWTGHCHNDYCDSFYSGYSDLFTAAVNKNISVVVATGNAQMNGYVSTPACVKPAVRVGSVNRYEYVSWFSNVWNQSMILAPGSLINSTALNESYVLKSGTSMSAPHVSASFLLLNEFLSTKNTSYVYGWMVNNSKNVTYQDQNYSMLDLSINFNEAINGNETSGEENETVVDPELELDPGDEPLDEGVIEDNVYDLPVASGGGAGGTVFRYESNDVKEDVIEEQEEISVLDEVVERLKQVFESNREVVLFTLIGVFAYIYVNRGSGGKNRTFKKK